MKSKPNLDQFLAGGQAAAAEVPAAAPAAAQPAPAASQLPDSKAPTFRITKTIRMDKSLDLALKRAALERGADSGSRVTESDLIEEALKFYLKL